MSRQAKITVKTIVRQAVFLFVCVWLAACAGPQTETQFPIIDAAAQTQQYQVLQTELFDQRMQQLQTVHSVSWPILSVNTPLCETNAKRYNGIKFVAGSISAFEAAFKPLATSFLKSRLDVKSVTVLAVADASPAWAAGLRPLDRLVAIDGEPIAKEHFFKSWRALTDSQDQVSITIKRETTDHAGERQSQEKTLRFALTPSCDYPVHLRFDRFPNAMADRKQISITTAMVERAPSEDTIAYIMGHELAHVIQRHAMKKITSGALTGRTALVGVAEVMARVVDGVGGLLFGKNSGLAKGGGKLKYAFESVLFNQKDLEREADYVGLYLYARTGRSLENLESLWRFFYLNAPQRSRLPVSHPHNEERMLSLFATRQEIQQKIQEKEPLLPNYVEAL